MSTDPTSWTVPQWHPDLGDPQPQLRLLRTLAVLFLQRCRAGSVELLQVEEGYLHVDLRVRTSKVGEVHIVERGADMPGAWYGVFLFPSHGDVERYFRDAKDAVEFIISACGAKRCRKRARRTMHTPSPASPAPARSSSR